MRPIFPVYAPYLAWDTPNDNSHIHHIVPARPEISRITRNGYRNFLEWTQLYCFEIGWRLQKDFTYQAKVSRVYYK